MASAERTAGSAENDSVGRLDAEAAFSVIGSASVAGALSLSCGTGAEDPNDPATARASAEPEDIASFRANAGRRSAVGARSALPLSLAGAVRAKERGPEVELESSLSSIAAAVFWDVAR